MNCVIDWGNTRGKLGLFEANQLLEIQYIDTPEKLWLFLEKILFEKVIISDVSKKLKEFPEKFRNKILFLESTTPLPIQIDYETPETLGVDRIAAAVGAYTLKPNKDCLVIDLGTCITYDLITENTFRGGSITLGVNLRFKALKEYTAGLPLTSIENQEVTFIKPAQSTKAALQSGVIEGILAEIQYFIQKYQKEYPNLQVLICGGDRIFFETKIKEQIFVVSNLTLLGLQRILEHYEKYHFEN